MATLISNLTDDRYTVYDSSNARFQATGDIGLDGMLNLTIRTRLGDGMRSTVVRGAEQFQKIVRHFVGRFRGLRGNWKYEDNLAAFNQAIGNGMTLEQAAMHTWTGQQALIAGYPRVEFIELAGQSGAYHTVKVNFLPRLK